MTERSIGEYSWVNNYVGLHYEVGGRTKSGVDCYGLLCLVYREKFGIELPDWATDEEIDWDSDRGHWVSIPDPVDFAFVRTRRSGGLPDHWGVIVAGGVLSADVPSSSFVPLDRYLAKNPETEIGVFELPVESLS